MGRIEWSWSAKGGQRARLRRQWPVLDIFEQRRTRVGAEGNAKVGSELSNVDTGRKVDDYSTDGARG